MCLVRGHNASLDPQLLGLKSSTLPPSHCALKKMQCSFITPVMPYGIASYFVCCMFFFLFFTANYVDPAFSRSLFEPCHKIAAINVALMQQPF